MEVKISAFFLVKFIQSFSSYCSELDESNYLYKTRNFSSKSSYSLKSHSDSSSLGAAPVADIFQVKCTLHTNLCKRKCVLRGALAQSTPATQVILKTSQDKIMSTCIHTHILSSARQSFLLPNILHQTSQLHFLTRSFETAQHITKG